LKTVCEGRVVKKEESLCFVQTGKELMSAVSDCNIGDSVFVLIRPEHITVSRHREESSARNIFRAKISAIEPWGLEYKLTLEQGNNFELIAFVTHQSVMELGLNESDEIFVTFKATAVHLVRR